MTLKIHAYQSKHDIKAYTIMFFFSNLTSEESFQYFDLRDLGVLLDELAKQFCKFLM